jgi:hypothetical protein
LLRRAKKNDRKKSSKTEGKKKKTEETKATYFVMIPDGFLCKKVFIVLLNSAFYETPKNAIKQIDGKKKSTFVLGLRQMYVTFVIFSWLSLQVGKSGAQNGKGPWV